MVLLDLSKSDKQMAELLVCTTTYWEQSQRTIKYTHPTVKGLGHGDGAWGMASPREELARQSTKIRATALLHQLSGCHCSRALINNYEKQKNKKKGAMMKME